MSSCQDYKALRDGYLEGTLNKQDALRFEAHFIECRQCQEAVQIACPVETPFQQLPKVTMPQSVRLAILNKVMRQENRQFWQKFSFLQITPMKLAGAGVALTILVLIFTGLPGKVTHKQSDIHYTQEEILRAQEEMKWSLVYVNQVVTEAKKQTVEDVLLNQLPTTVRDCVEKTVPFLKGGSQ